MPCAQFSKGFRREKHGLELIKRGKCIQDGAGNVYILAREGFIEFLSLHILSCSAVNENSHGESARNSIGPRISVATFNEVAISVNIRQLSRPLCTTSLSQKKRVREKKRETMLLYTPE